MDASKLGALASVLARDLDSVEDLPNYVSPPPGIYKLAIKGIDHKEINEKTTIVAEYIVVDCVQLADPQDETDQVRLKEIKLGKDIMSEVFYFDKADKIETTLSVLKAKYGGLAPALGTTNLLEIITKMVGMQVQAQVTNRLDKEDKNKIYAATKHMVAAV